MYVVLGASGNTGHIVANNLLARGQKVRVVGRNSAHLQPLTAKGAETFIADATDAGALTKAFQQADAAYVMIPPNPASTDPVGYSNRVSDAIAAAVQSAGTKNYRCPQQHRSRYRPAEPAPLSACTISKKSSTRLVAQMCSTCEPHPLWKIRSLK